MNNHKIIFFIILGLFSQATIAESWYQVEVVVFDRLYPNLDGEQWQDTAYETRDKLVELQASDASQDRVPFMILDKSRNRLAGIYQYFKFSSEYRPLLHFSWQQPATERRQSRFVHLQRLDGESTVPVVNTEEPEFLEEIIQLNKILDGGIRIRSGFYLHADVDLTYFKELSPENKVIRTSEDLGLNSEVKTPIALKETRKLKLNEIHYFDHPMFGVILQVSRL